MLSDTASRSFRHKFTYGSAADDGAGRHHPVTYGEAVIEAMREETVAIQDFCRLPPNMSSATLPGV
jgi:hypothetical protein